MVPVDKIFFVFLIVSASCGEVTAQVATGEFIRSAFQDHEVRTFDDQLLFLSQRSYRMPAIREVQLRTQNRELLRTQQEYELRVSPANPWEIKANNEYYKNFAGSLSVQREIALRDALLERYWTVIEIVYFQEMKETSAQGMLTLKQQLAILENQVGSSYFDPDEFAELKVDELDYGLELEEYDHELSNQIYRVERMYPEAHQKSVTWTAKEIIPVNRIKEVADSLSDASVRSSLIAYQQQQVLLAQSHHTLEKRNFNLGFVQGSYDRRRVNQERTPYNISAGVTIPIFNPNKGDMARRKLQVIEAEYDLKEAQDESRIDKQILEKRLGSVVSRYASLKSRAEDLRNSNFAQTLSEIKGGDPLMYVQFNERLRRLEMLLIKVHRDILLTYVEYLSYIDHLQQMPLINFLDPQLRQIPVSR